MYTFLEEARGYQQVNTTTQDFRFEQQTEQQQASQGHFKPRVHHVVSTDTGPPGQWSDSNVSTDAGPPGQWSDSNDNPPVDTDPQQARNSDDAPINDGHSLVECEDPCWFGIKCRGVGCKGKCHLHGSLCGRQVAALEHRKHERWWKTVEHEFDGNVRAVVREIKRLRNVGERGSRSGLNMVNEFWRRLRVALELRHMKPRMDALHNIHMDVQRIHNSGVIPQCTQPKDIPQPPKAKDIPQSYFTKSLRTSETTLPSDVCDGPDAKSDCESSSPYIEQSQHKPEPSNALVVPQRSPYIEQSQHKPEPSNALVVPQRADWTRGQQTVPSLYERLDFLLMALCGAASTGQFMMDLTRLSEVIGMPMDGTNALEFIISVETRLGISKAASGQTIWESGSHKDGTLKALADSGDVAGVVLSF